MLLSQQPRQTTLDEVLQAIEDVELTRRFADYVVDPTMENGHIWVANNGRPGYVMRFKERYLDPDCYHCNNPIPEFMATAMFRLGAALLDYMISVRADTITPQVTHYDFLHARRAELKARGYSVYKFDYSEEFASELLAIRTKFGLLWLPLEQLVQWVNNLNQSMLDAALAHGF